MTNFKTVICLLSILVSGLAAAAEVHVESDVNQEELQKIVDSLAPGDTLTLAKGIYRASLSINTDSILVRAEKLGETYLVGTKVVSSPWKPVKINGARAYVADFPEKVTDVFVDGKLMQLSRYPDKTVEYNSMKDWMFCHTDTQVEFSLIESTPKNLSKYCDGYYVGNHTGDEKFNTVGLVYWTTFSIPITGATNNTIKVDSSMVSSGFWNPERFHGEGTGLGFIIGAKAALDAPGEWWWGDGKLYLIPPKDISLEGAFVEARVRDYCIVSSGKGVKLSSLNLIAGSIWLKGDNSEIDHCSVDYITPFRHTPADTHPTNKQSRGSQWGLPELCTCGVYVEGDGCFIHDSYFGHSWNSGVTLAGDREIIQNCFIEDVNWLGRRHAGINSFGDGNIIRYCTVRKTGSSAIEGGNSGEGIGLYEQNNVWEHNYIEYPACLCVDQGFFYVNMQSGLNGLANSVWRYNVCKGARGPDKGKWANTSPGLYVDNNSSGYLVHHNIIIDAKEAFRYNDRRDAPHQGHDAFFYNNTVVNCDINFMHGIKGGTVPDADIVVMNNVATGNDTPFRRIFPNGVQTPGCNNFEDIPADKMEEFCRVQKGLPVFVYKPELDSEATGIDYVGAVDPEKGMFSYGSDVKAPSPELYLSLLKQGK